VGINSGGGGSDDNKLQFMRDRAEELARSRQKTDYERRVADRDKLLQELHVHQIELELQNEELRQAQAKLQYAHQQYLNLYNEAPMGYASLDDTGIIIRANQMLATMLGVEKYRLIGRAIAEFMHHQDQTIFRSRFNAFANHPEDKHIDIRFKQHRDNDKFAQFVGRIQGRRLDKDEVDQNNVRWTETLLIVISDVSELKKTEERIQYQAYHDALTGIPNRTMLYDQLESALSLAKRQDAYGALVFMDLDRFKNVNDSLGHHSGDELLIEFTKRLRKHVRKEDLFARMGGDEFVILLAEQHHNNNVMAVNAQRFADHVDASLSESLLVQGHPFQVSISMGITIFPFHDSDSVNDVVRQADTAMYQAKNDGRGLVRFYHSTMQDAAKQRMTLEAELRVALIEAQFELYFQPQVSKDGKLHALEALLRWRHPFRGIVSPNKFIGMAEDTGMIVPLGDWVVENFIKQIAEWGENGVVSDDLRFAVNISPKQLELVSFCDKVEGWLKQYSVNPECLVFEITESLLLPSDEISDDVLKRLSKTGLVFSVDDFGTGYSSLATIQNTPIGQLKIDRQFINQLKLLLESDDQQVQCREYALVNAILSLGKALGLEVVAEGVETEMQREALQQLGCHYMQGYLFARPVPAAEIPKLLQRFDDVALSLG
jgi:diguanylate cyclase (GGDEF)-like protein/PAS domain S-box-containing protein